ncbi:hypothetical protein JYU34_004641 [Plutella xylostella]|uniref:Uncharacterized protein n=1 Tax=Plutella xylostella TaxID=51655 RepID=A0ABQ7QYH1_PLUXY|nr:hypothetical protein JYU34_004641 [Plutella xylostella]
MEEKLAFSGLKLNLRCMRILGTMFLDPGAGLLQYRIHRVYMRMAILLPFLFIGQQLINIYQVRRTREK